MRVGTSLRSGYVISDVRKGAQWMIERARAASAAGLDSLTEDPNGELTIEVPADIVDDNATVLVVDFAPARP